MAINFLNTVDLNKNQLNQAVIQNVATDPASAVVGQIIFNTNEDTLKQYVADTGSGNSGWESIGGDIQKVDGGTYVTVTNPDGPIPIVNHDATTRTDTTSAATPDYGVSFTAIDSVTTNATGHVTAANVKTVTLPADTNETYTLPVTAGATSPSAPTSAKISLTAGGTGTGVKSTVEFIGTTGRIDVTSLNQNNGTITIDLTDSVSIAENLAVGGIIAQSGSVGTNSLARPLDMNSNKLLAVATGTSSTDGVNLGQVEALVAGLGSFQGGYDASTNTPALSGASNVAVGNGDFYVVTTAGTLFTKVLEVGDFIFANTDIAANSSPSESDYIYVISDANIAGAGATDGATQKGVAGFDSASFNVTSSGWVQLDAQKNANGAKQVLNNTAPCSRAEAGGLTTFSINLADASLFGIGALAENVKVEITEATAPFQTVYADVTRSGSGSLNVAFTGSVSNGVYQVLLTHI